jgi:hypothetical protein
MAKRDFHETLSEAIDMGFADRARLHDRLIHEACEAFQAEREQDRAHEGLRISRLADCVKAMMFAEHADAAEAWHGPYSR